MGRTGESERRTLCEIGAYLHGRGWSVGTSSNYSILLSREPFRLLLTASGKDKGRLTQDDFVIVDAAGKVLEGAPHKPSAEMWLHVVLTLAGGAGAVLHTHSPWATVLSERYGRASTDAFIPYAGYEMLKGLDGCTTHESTKNVAIYPNTQDIPVLAQRVKEDLQRADPLRHGFLMRRHGLYAWGATIEGARRHLEVLEFLFETRGLELQVGLSPD